MATPDTQHARLVGSETPLLEEGRDRYVGHDDALVLPGISLQTPGRMPVLKTTTPRARTVQTSRPAWQRQAHGGSAERLLAIAIWLAPRLASALRQRMFDSARNLGQRAAEQYQHVGTRVGPAYTRDTRGLRHPGVRIKIRPDWSYIRDVNAKAF